MRNPLTMKLRHGSVLTEEDRCELDGLVSRSVTLASREVVLSEGDSCASVYVLMSGWACRFKVVPGADRQIVAFMLPGDHSPIQSGLGDAVTYGLCALTGCELAEVDGLEVDGLLRTRPNLARAFRWSSMTDEAVLQEWLANVGRRPAERRMAHLLCEFLLRLQTIGLASADAFDLPLTQSVLGDALGLSSAHVNRTLQTLRSRGLVFFEGGKVEFSSVARLQKFAGFNARYLNLKAVEPHLAP